MDNINHPPHYTKGKIEPIEVIEDWGLGYCDGGALKYIARYKHKGDPLSDLKKARWYIDRLISGFEPKAEQGVCRDSMAGLSYKIPDNTWTIRYDGTTVDPNQKHVYLTSTNGTNGLGLNTQMSFYFGEEGSLP